MGTEKSWLVILVILLVAVCPAPGQSQSYHYSLLNEDAGLPQNFIYSLTQDSRGFVWIGTGKGLSRYDGRTVASYFKEQGLWENFITTSFRTSAGHILYGHYGGGLSYFDGVAHHPLLTDTLQSEVIAMAEDRQGAVWCIGKSGKILRLTRNLDGFALLTPGELRGKIVNDMILCGNQVFVATNEGLYTFIISGPQLIFKDTPSEIQFEEILSVGKYGADSLHIWAGATGGRFLRIKTGVATAVDRSYQLPAETGTGVTALAEAGDGHLWVGTSDRGLYELRMDDTKGIMQTTLYETARGYPIQSVRKILVDANADIWIGTASEGVVKLYRPPFAFQDMRPFGITQINDIQIRSGIYYLATASGLYVFDASRADGNKIKWLPAFGHEPIQCLAARPDSVLWVATTRQGVVLFDQRSNQKKILEIRSAQGDPIKARLIRADRHGNCWISAIGNGVFKMSPEGKLMEHLSTQTGFIHNDIFAIYPDENDGVWFGSLGAGLARLDAHDSLQFFSQTGVFPSHDVNDITGDGKGNIWIATDGFGYFHFDGKNFEKSSVQSDDQTPFVKSIEYDPHQGLWLTHRKGLSFVDLTTMERRDFTPKDGLQSNLSYAGNLLVDSRQVVINNGWGFTLADRLETTRRLPLAPTLTEVKLFLHETLTPPPTVAEVRDQRFPQMHLDYDKNHLTFFFTTVDHHYAGPIYYRYHIVEIEPEWSPLTLDTQVTYSSLDPGRYTLLVQASPDAGHWINPPMEYQFVIKKPYWERWWFYVAQALVICIIFGMTYYLSRAKSKKGAIVSVMIFMCLFVIYESVQNWAETVFPMLHGSAPILRTTINLLFAFAFYPIEKWIRHFFTSDGLKNH